jgi:GTP cyclohydrolase I
MCLNRRVDEAAAARAIEAFLRALGKEPEGELASTPVLVARAWCRELLEGEGQDPEAILRLEAIDAGDDARAAGVVLVRDLAVAMMCPHHLLPAHGRADLLYLPDARLVGVGALARALRAATRRLTLQEQAGARMAHALVAALGARGALCRLRLTHTCMVARGAREADALVETVALAGALSGDGPERRLALGTLAAGGETAGGGAGG